MDCFHLASSGSIAWTACAGRRARTIRDAPRVGMFAIGRCWALPTMATIPGNGRFELSYGCGKAEGMGVERDGVMN